MGQPLKLELGKYFYLKITRMAFANSLKISLLAAIYNSFLFVNQSGADERKYLTGAQSFHLTAEQLQKTIENARKGDSEAAYKLFLYFEFSKLDASSGRPWLRRAAEGGLVLAQYTFGIVLLHDSATRKEAVTWIEKVAGREPKTPQERELVTSAKDMLARIAAGKESPFK
jgi:TPR repeat protein